jgi:hypothetical protein
MRTLKVLRMVENYPGVRHVVNTILLSMPRMLDVLVLLGFVWLIFGILGSRLWMGALRHCNDNTIIEKKNCIGMFNLTLDQCHWMPTNIKMKHCIDMTDVSMTNVTSSSTSSSALSSYREFPRAWENISPWDFDNIGHSLLTVFVATSGETWPNMMYDTINARGYDQPMYEMQPGWPPSAWRSGELFD